MIFIKKYCFNLRVLVVFVFLFTIFSFVNNVQAEVGESCIQTEQCGSSDEICKSTGLSAPMGICTPSEAGTRCEDDSSCGDGECRDFGAVSFCMPADNASSDDASDNADDSPSNTGTNTEVVSLESPIDIDSPGELMAAVINAIMGIIGLASVLAMVYAGILYFTSGGNEEQAGKAKKTITYAILGLVVSILSYVIVNTLISAIGG